MKVKKIIYAPGDKSHLITKSSEERIIAATKI